MSLIYGEYLVNVHFSDIPHTFILHSTLHSSEKKAEASTREPVRVSSMTTSTGSHAGITHAHEFPCSNQPC